MKIPYRLPTFIIRSGTVRGSGLYLGAYAGWRGSQRNAHRYYERVIADSVARRVGGRVVRLKRRAAR